MAEDKATNVKIALLEQQIEKLTLMISKLLDEFTHKPHANVLKDPKIESSKIKTSSKNKHVKP